MSETRTLAGGRPLFLLGAPRSGTTLLTRILNAHREVLLTNESALFVQVADNIRRSPLGRKQGITFGKTHGDLWAEVLTDHAHELFDDFYTRLATSEGRPPLAFCGEKHPHMEMAFDLLGRTYPDAMYVHLVRDPRDSACSIAEMNGSPVLQALDNMPRRLSRVDAFASGLPTTQYVRIRYEDLVMDYEGEAASLFAVLGLSMDDTSTRYVRKFGTVDSHSGVAARGSRAAKVSDDALRREATDFRETSVARWRRELTPHEQAHAVRALGTYLERHGYPLT